MNKNNFVIFADCIPVKGAQRSLICDMQNNIYHIIPNGLCDILKSYNGKTIDFVKQVFEHNYDEVIDEYFDFLISNNLVFFDSNPDYFPRIDLKWETPSQITNVIIDYEFIDHDFKSIIQQLEGLKCSFVQLRFYKEITVEKIFDLAQLVEQEKSRIVSIDFIIPYSEEISILKLEETIKIFPRIPQVSASLRRVPGNAKSLLTILLTTRSNFG